MPSSSLPRRSLGCRSEGQAQEPELASGIGLMSDQPACVVPSLLPHAPPADPTPNFWEEGRYPETPGLGLRA